MSAYLTFKFNDEKIGLKFNECKIDDLHDLVCDTEFIIDMQRPNVWTLIFLSGCGGAIISKDPLPDMSYEVVELIDYEKNDEGKIVKTLVFVCLE